MIETRQGNVELQHEGFEGTLNVDDMTNIHYENIEGEILNIATDLNKVGMLRAEAERLAKKAKLTKEIYASKFNRDCRREASLNSNHFTIGGDRIKLTENSLKEALYLDKRYQRLSEDLIETETNFESMDSIYWAVKEKASKLNKLSFRDSQDS